MQLDGLSDEEVVKLLLHTARREFSEVYNIKVLHPNFHAKAAARALRSIETEARSISMRKRRNRPEADMLPEPCVPADDVFHEKDTEGSSSAED